MAHLQTTQVLLTAASDGVLAGLLVTYIGILPKRDRSPRHGVTIVFLSGYAMIAVVEALLIASFSSPIAALLGLLARASLMGGLVYSAIILSRTLSQVRDESREELNKKLQLEFADRRKVEQELAHLASFAEQDPSAIIEMDERGTVRYLNPAAEQSFADLKAKGKSHPIFEGLDAMLSFLKQEKRSLSARLIQFGDRIYRQQISRAETGPGLRVHMADVTELKRLEQIQADLLARLPGELQTPLSAVQQSLQSLIQVLRPQLIREQEDEFLTALKQMGHLSRLAHEMIESSHTDTGRIDIHRQRVDIAALAKDVVGFMESLAQDKGLTFTLRSEPAVIEMLMDRDKIRAALMEIMQQAIDRAAHGRVEVSLISKGSEVEWAVVVPVPGAEQAAADLRLTASRAIIQAHGGRLAVQGSTKGIQCTLTVPALSADDFFYERARRLHETAVAKETSFSLIRLYLPDWAATRKEAGEEQADALWRELQRLVSQMLRNESDFAVETRQNIWMALPGARRDDSQSIVERIQRGLLECTSPTAPKPVELRFQMSVYPDNGRTIESLLLLIGWFTEGRQALAASPPAKQARRAA